MMRYYQFITYLLVLIGSHSSASAQQEVDFDGIYYGTIGFNFTHNIGSFKGYSWGPEIAFGKAFEGNRIASICFGYESNRSTQERLLYSKVQGGHMFVGGALGPTYLMSEKKSGFMIQADGWVGMFGYAMISLRGGPYLWGHSITGKLKAPVPLYFP